MLTGCAGREQDRLDVTAVKLTQSAALKLLQSLRVAYPETARLPRVRMSALDLPTGRSERAHARAISVPRPRVCIRLRLTAVLARAHEAMMNRERNVRVAATWPTLPASASFRRGTTSGIARRMPKLCRSAVPDSDGGAYVSAVAGQQTRCGSRSRGLLPFVPGERALRQHSLTY